MSKMNKLTFFLGAFLLVGYGCAPEAQNQPNEENNNELEPRELSSQYESMLLTRVAEFEHPWSVAFKPDGSKLVTERPGRLNLVTEDGEVTEISGLPDIAARGQGGLMEVSLHPQYEDNGWVYLTYSKPGDDENTATALARGQLEGEELVDTEDIFIQNEYSGPGRHYGSRLAWTNEGYLLMSIGDRGADPPRAQENDDHAGTLLRLNDDGSVPSGNPFVGDDNALDEIYSYGHRNIQGLVVDPETNEIWVTEHGPRGGDELNYIEPGLNYGWPVVTLGLDYRTEGEFPHAESRRKDGMEEPVYELLPTLAPSGLALVTADNFPNWEGNLLAGGLRAERIRRLVIGEYEGQYEVFHDEELLLQEIGRIRDVREGPDGNIYVATDHSDGGLYRIEPRE